jgi:hypothetical protein
LVAVPAEIEPSAVQARRAAFAAQGLTRARPARADRSSAPAVGALPRSSARYLDPEVHPAQLDSDPPAGDQVPKLRHEPLIARAALEVEKLDLHVASRAGAPRAEAQAGWSAENQPINGPLRARRGLDRHRGALGLAGDALVAARDWRGRWRGSAPRCGVVGHEMGHEVPRSPANLSQARFRRKPLEPSST